jgi:ATP-binding cassette subfamily B protein
VQTLAMMTFTLMVVAPIMMIGGIFMAIRQDLNLSWLVMVTVPALALALGFIISRMIPAYRTMQTRIDGVNRVLREQATGIRVLRAFVREPFEEARFPGEYRVDVSITVGRWIAAMSPRGDVGAELGQRGRLVARRSPGRQRGDVPAR